MSSVAAVSCVLTLIMLGNNFSREHFEIMYSFSPKYKLRMFYAYCLSRRQFAWYVKGDFSGEKNKKTIINLSSAEIAQRKVKPKMNAKPALLLALHVCLLLLKLKHRTRQLLFTILRLSIITLMVFVVVFLIVIQQSSSFHRYVCPACWGGVDRGPLSLPVPPLLKYADHL